ncbi:MAG: chorismate mutase [Frankiales bacterium]|nr:chorismate mutase [Frankiales bacterium]
MLNAPHPVLDGRRQIDEIDAQLISLITERSRLSACVQQARLAGGGSRISHSREVDVVKRWRSALGGVGGQLALSLLELGRGPLGS